MVQMDISMFSARMLGRSHGSPSGIHFDSDAGVVFRPLGDILHDSGGFKPGQILGTCSGEMGEIFWETGRPSPPWDGRRSPPQIPKRRPSGAEHFFQWSRASAEGAGTLPAQAVANASGIGGHYRNCLIGVSLPPQVLCLNSEKPRHMTLAPLSVFQCDLGL